MESISFARSFICMNGIEVWGGKLINLFLGMLVESRNMTLLRDLFEKLKMG